MSTDLLILYAYAYFIGSIPTAYIIGRLVKGIDIRQYGSGNVGGSNLFFNVSKGWVFPLGFFEVLIKGASPIWMGLYVFDLDRSSHFLIGAALLVLVGNNWSIFLRFTGGRGIAVTSGLLFALAPREMGIFIAVAMAGWYISRSSGIWVLISLTLLPLWSFFLGEPLAVIWFSAAVLGVVSLKRLVGNWTPLPEGMPVINVLVNRLLKDRDTSSRDEWVLHRPVEREQR